MSGPANLENRMTEAGRALVRDAHDEAMALAMDLDEAVEMDEPMTPTEILGLVIEAERQVEVLGRLLVAARTTLQRGTGSGVVR